MNPRRAYYLLNRAGIRAQQALASLCLRSRRRFYLITDLLHARGNQATRVLLHEVIKLNE